MENKREKEYIDNLPETLNLVIEEGDFFSLDIASFSKEINSKIIVDVKKGGRFVGAFADFADSNTLISATINLLGEGASCEWHTASLSSKKEKKDYQIDVSHKAKGTTALVSNYGIAREESFLKFSGLSEIVKGASGSSTKQEAKIIVFDPKSDGLASPALKIDDNDVEASHAAVVGRLNEQHLFYLESRGLSLPLAKRLIALGYLKPIEGFFEDEKTKNMINDAIERGFDDVGSL